MLRLPAAMAPVKVAVLPLLKKDGMPEVAQRIVDDLKYDYNCLLYTSEDRYRWRRYQVYRRAQEIIYKKSFHSLLSLIHILHCV